MMSFIDSIHPILLYFLIFIVKIFEVAISTLRMVIVTKGERAKGAFIAFFEVSIWVLLAATVLTNITEDPFKIVVYAAAFSIGNFSGSKMEEKLALGTVKIEAIVKKIHGRTLTRALRETGLAVTSVDAYGRDDLKEIIYMHVPRKRIKQTLNLVRSFQSDVVITITDIRPVYGGYGLIRK